MNRHKRTKRLGNVYGEQFGQSFGGNVWSVGGIAPTLKTTAASSQQFVIEVMHEQDNNSGQLPQE